MSLARSEISEDAAPAEGLLADRGTRERLSGPGFRTFLAIADRLGLTVAQQLVLLGGTPSATYHHWKSKGAPSLSHDALERVSLVLGIWKGLRLIFSDDATALRWLKAGNADLPFAGASPLQTMLRGSINDLYSVRRYLDGWRGVWP